MNNRFMRFHLLVGEDEAMQFRSKTVLILGVGGVGGYVVEALARCGISTLILVDYDIVDITNINRQLVALDSTIGKKKVDLFENRIKDINAQCKVIKIDQRIDSDNYLELFQYKIDFIADCCDDIRVKKCIIEYALENHINIISSMGLGNRMNPSMLEIIDIRKTCNDPLARIIRKFVNDKKIKSKLPVVCSKELPKKLKGSIISSNSFVPATGGLLIASYIVKELTKK